MRDLKTEVRQHIEAIITAEGFDLVEIKLARFKKKYRVQIFIDSDHGVNLDDCAYLSRLTGAALEVADLFTGGYVLEMSSPGIDRPLTSERDFRRRIGRKIRLELEEDGKVTSVQGKLTDVIDEGLVIDGSKGEMKVSLDRVVQGKVII